MIDVRRNLNSQPPLRRFLIDEGHGLASAFECSAPQARKRRWRMLLSYKIMLIIQSTAEADLEWQIHAHVT
jgi:hypothetical protein